MTPVAAALAVVVRGPEVLLIRRANMPDQGLWACPGGRIEAGETMFAAAERELLEETGVQARAIRLLDAIDILERDASGALQRHFILLAVACDWQQGEPSSADDALDAAWFEVAGLVRGDPRFSADVARLSGMAAGQAI